MKDQYDFSKGTRGAVVETRGKTQITLYLDDYILTAFQKQAAEQGMGCQTLINEILHASLNPNSALVTVEILRKVLQEELHAA